MIYQFLKFRDSTTPTVTYIHMKIVNGLPRFEFSPMFWNQWIIDPILLKIASFLVCFDLYDSLYISSMQSIQNLGLAVVAIIAGKIVDSKGYLILEVFFMGCLSSEYNCFIFISQRSFYWNQHIECKKGLGQCIESYLRIGKTSLFTYVL